jgi:hypothetical protein
MQFPIRVGLFLLLVVLGVFPLGARVLRIEITSRTNVLQGNAFGETWAYERIIGRVYFSAPVANRGRASRMTWVEGGDSSLANDDGDAWLLRDGFTVVSLG